MMGKAEDMSNIPPPLGPIMHLSNELRQLDVCLDKGLLLWELSRHPRCAKNSDLADDGFQQPFNITRSNRLVLSGQGNTLHESTCMG